MAEIWLPIPTVEGLEASSLGRVRVIPYPREMPCGGQRMYGGHPWFGNIARDVSRPRRVIRFRGKTLKVHRLVCLAFHGLPPAGRGDVLHRNGDTLQNAESNLRWATRSEVVAQTAVDAAITI